MKGGAKLLQRVESFFWKTVLATYHYFKSKMELLESVVHDMVDEYVIGVHQVLDKQYENAIEKLGALSRPNVANGKFAKIIASIHRPGNSEMHTRLLAVTIIKLAPLFGRVIEQGCQEGLFQTQHSLECAELLLADIQFMTDQGIYPWDEEDLVRRSGAIPEFIESILRAPKNSFCFLLDGVRQ